MKKTLVALAILTILSGVLAVIPGNSAQAQGGEPESVIAIVGDSGDVRVSWAATSVDTDYYVIKWKPADGGNAQYPRSYSGDHPAPRTNPGDTTFDPVSAGERHSYVIATEAVDWVEVKWVGPTASSGFGERVYIGDGLPVDVQAVRSGDSLTVTWKQNPATVGETVTRYVVWHREEGWTGGGIRSASNEAETAAGELVLSGLTGPSYEVELRAVYEPLGKTKRTDQWVAQTEVARTGDLTDQCRPDPSPDPANPNAHTRIGAVGQYDETRIPLETQVWFFPTEDHDDVAQTGDSFGHAHLLTCVPHTILDSPVTTPTLRLDFEVIAHLHAAEKLDGSRLDAANDVEVRIQEIEIRGRDGSGSDILIDRQFLDSAITCQSGQACPAFTASIDVELFGTSNVPDKPGFAFNGLKELRIAVIHEVYDLDPPDAPAPEHVASMRAIMRHPFALEIPGHPENQFPDFNPTITESSGWLVEDDRNGTGGYATIGVVKVDGVRGVLPVAPISKSATPQLELQLHVEADPCRLNCLVNFMPVTKFWGFLDPKFHAAAICEDGTDTSCLEFSGDIEIPPPGVDDPVVEDRYTVTVDVSDLSVGTHRLVLAVQQPMVDGYSGASRDTDFQENITIADGRFRSTITGLLIVRFEVVD